MRTILLAAVLAATSACQTDPLNGTVVDGPPLGKTFTYQGYSNHPGQHIVLEALATPSTDPGPDGNWKHFGDAYTGNNPLYINGNTTNPLYSWTTTATPVAVAADQPRWPSGGLLRTRARSVDQGAPRVLTTFDAVTYGPCFGEHYAAGDDWSTIGTACAGLGTGTVAMANTNFTPQQLPGPQKPDWLGKKGDISATETGNYYDAWQAPATFTDFKGRYGFPSGEITATYFNDGDLGLGREMHCRAYNSATWGQGVACYVINYSGTAGQAVFDGNVNTILTDAINHQNSFATVCMVFTEPATDRNSTKFVVYLPDGSRTKTAKLDSTGVHQSIPNNCLTCHGISANYSSQDHKVDANAKFLAFDPYAYQFSTQAGFTLNDQQEKFRKLNQLIMKTSPTPAIKDLINGMYADQGGVNQSGAWAEDNYVPAGWTDSNGVLSQSAYLGIVKVGCRTCHASSTSAPFDFLESTDWSGSAMITSLRKDICGKFVSSLDKGHSMPQAERVSKRFWASGGRAYLMTGWPVSPTDGLEGCDP